ncbi:hypothetical protein [Castellaniella caeni]|uniref:hypothetical protein n=1 Tax=Castellaniella caeni TaxID=266123 RepID=UPI001E31B45A|nr:hypothetical protein [Castellaniella caeni]
MEAVEQAERSRAPVQRLADQLAGYLVYFALGAAVFTWFITRDIRSTISVTQVRVQEISHSSLVTPLPATPARSATSRPDVAASE